MATKKVLFSVILRRADTVAAKAGITRNAAIRDLIYMHWDNHIEVDFGPAPGGNRFDFAAQKPGPRKTQSFFPRSRWLYPLKLT